MLPPRLLACCMLPQSQRVGAGWQVGECVSLCLPCVPSPGVCGSQPKHKHKYSSFEHIVRLAGVFLFLQCLHCVFWDLCLETIKMYWQPVIFGFWGIWFWSQCPDLFSELFQEVALIQFISPFLVIGCLHVCWIKRESQSWLNISNINDIGSLVRTFRTRNGTFRQ